MMKRFYKIIFLICLTVFLSPVGWGQPTLTNWNGPASGRTQVFAQSPSGVIYAGTLSGLRISTDDGQTWSLGGLPDYSVVALSAPAEDTIIAGCTQPSVIGGNYRIVQSTDGGVTWETRLTFSNTSYRRIHDLITFNNGTILLSNQPATDAFTDTLLFRSTDNGTHWTSLPVTGTWEWGTTKDDEGLVYLCTTDGIFYSTNTGLTWTACASQVHFPNSIKAFSQHRIIISGEEGQYPDEAIFTYSSVDTGRHWTRSDTVRIPFSFFVGNASVYQNRFYCASFGEIYNFDGLLESNDSGSHWSRPTNFPFFCNTTFVTNSGRLLVGGPVTAFYDEMNNSWVQTLTGFGEQDQWCGQALALLSSNQLGLAAYISGFFIVNGQNNTLPSCVYRNGYELTYTQQGGLFLSADSGYDQYGYIKNCLFRSTDLGQTWTLSFYDTNLTNIEHIATLNDGTIFISGGRIAPDHTTYLTGVRRRSTDNGNTWSNVIIQGFTRPTNSPIFVEVPHIGVLSILSNNLSFVYGSTNRGDTWTLFDTLHTRAITGGVADENGNVFFAFNDSIAKSTDFGRTWNTIQRLPSVAAIIKDRYNNIYFGTLSSDSSSVSNIAIYKSTDAGETFTPLITQQMSYAYAYTMVVDSNGYLFLMTNNCDLFKTDQSVVSVRKSTNLLPVFSGIVNYPNPFNPSTTISFSLPNRSLVHLTIYDALGQKVTTLLSGQAMVAGNHSVIWNAERFASGVYFCRMEVGSYTATRKILLMK